MLLEQEIASIMAFAIYHAGNPSPYYYNVPESFQYPAIYFPQPEIDTGGETFRTYNMRYVWYINLFDATTEGAHEKAWNVLTALKRNRNLVPLIDENGAPEGGKLRLDDPSLKSADEGAVQLTLTWTSRRPYDAEEVQKMVEWEVNGWKNPDVYNDVSVVAAFNAAVKASVNNYPDPEYAGEHP